MRPARRRVPHTIAWRLASTYILVSLAVLVALSLAVYLATALYLDQTLDGELSSQADFYATYAATLAPDEASLAGLAPDIANLFASQSNLNVRIFSASNGLLLASTQDIGPEPSQAAFAELGHRGRGMFTVASRDLPNRRYAASPVRAGGQVAGVVEVSRPTDETQRFLASLRLILIVAIAAAVMALGIGSVLVARQIARPIADVEVATRRIAAGDLSARADAPSGDEIGRLASSVNDMASRLEMLESARARFISEVSHDLRTPLTAVKGMLANLVDRAGPAERPSLELAERETDRLIRLVSQLLDFARWRGGNLVLDRGRIDLNALGRDAVALCEARAMHRSVELSVDMFAGTLVLDGDADRLQRAILNLLENAIKFTPSGGDVTLSTARLGSEVEVAVSDSGRGMSAAEAARAFEPFYSGEGGGAGLGLAIVRAIVEAHGGRIGIESEVGSGCRVWFTLPA